MRLEKEIGISPSNEQCERSSTWINCRQRMLFLKFPLNLVLLRLRVTKEEDWLKRKAMFRTSHLASDFCQSSPTLC